MVPDLRLQGWTHGRARAQSEEEEKQRRGGQGREGVGFRARGVLSSPASLESSAFPSCHVPRSLGKGFV